MPAPPISIQLSPAADAPGKNKRPSRRAAAALALLLTAFVLPARADYQASVSKGNELYLVGQYAEALKYYEDAFYEMPNDDLYKVILALQAKVGVLEPRSKGSGAFSAEEYMEVLRKYESAFYDNPGADTFRPVTVLQEKAGAFNFQVRPWRKRIRTPRPTPVPVPTQPVQKMVASTPKYFPPGYRNVPWGADINKLQARLRITAGARHSYHDLDANARHCLEKLWGVPKLTALPDVEYYDDARLPKRDLTFYRTEEREAFIFYRDGFAARYAELSAKNYASRLAKLSATLGKPTVEEFSDYIKTETLSEDVTINIWRKAGTEYVLARNMREIPSYGGYYTYVYVLYLAQDFSDRMRELVKAAGREADSSQRH